MNVPAVNVPCRPHTAERASEQCCVPLLSQVAFDTVPNKHSLLRNDCDGTLLCQRAHPVCHHQQDPKSGQGIGSLNDCLALVFATETLSGEFWSLSAKLTSHAKRNAFVAMRSILKTQVYTISRVIFLPEILLTWRKNCPS